ncbi:MAG: gliding motility-associated C-terminal domain-containing protein [Flavobacteriales bacterium]|nr:gliding motility-associated C-terminal domain-containing protein [Flavobacteriales bacterium]
MIQHFFFTINGALKFYIPNAFNLNGDGLNETFGPGGIGMDTTDYSFIIIDRWGNLLFETSDITESWNGYTRGNTEKIPVAVYIWKISLKGDESTDSNARTSADYIGHVTVIR